MRQAEGKSNPFAGTFVRQGKYGAYDYGFKYTVMPDGSREIIAQGFDGKEHVIPLSEVGAGKPLHSALRKLVQTAKKEDANTSNTYLFTQAY